MACTVYWIKQQNANVGIMPSPLGGEWLADEIHSLADEGVNVLVSLLTPEEAEDFQLQEEAACCANSEIEFISFPIPDQSAPPQDAALDDFLSLLRDRISAGKRVVIHCWAGIGRSTIVAACLLLAPENSVDQIMAAISRARGYSVPQTRAQLQWVREYAARAAKENS